jgi:8-amino-7-oxononanoate synthase
VRAIEHELADLAARSLRRSLQTLDSPQGVEITIDGRTLINFSSNDYLGLANHPAVKQSVIRGVEKYGAGAGASRLVCGSLGAHAELETTLARIKGTEAALSFASGYAAAVGTLGALAGPRDIVILDKLAHASLIDGARLSNATVRVFPHNDVAQLARRLAWAAREIGNDGRMLVVTESIFSMDGDRAPLREIIDLKEKFGALLLLDEAHAFGLLGERGGGLAEECGLAARVDVQLGTLSKAAGLAGGYIAARREIIDLAVNQARPFIYSTAPPPALAAAAAEVVATIIAGREGARRRTRLWNNVRQFARCVDLPPPSSAIIPLVLGDEQRAVDAARALRERGFLVPAIRYPTVARGRARLRLTFSAAHREDQIDALAAAWQAVSAEIMGLSKTTIHSPGGK